MDDQKKFRLLVSGFGVLIVAFILVLAGLIKENSQCTGDPLVYGASRIEEYGAQTACQCTITNRDYISTFYFNGDGHFGDPPLTDFVRGYE